MATNRIKNRSSNRPSGKTRERKRSAATFAIAGIGASAGGLEAFTEFLRALPVDTGVGFVLVQHLDPTHESILTSLLARATALPVTEVTNNTTVRPNHIYVIPPNAKMTISRGVLRLVRREHASGPARSIDVFFESLAADQGLKAIGIILSGSAMDGTLGLEAIKNEGGITFAQEEKSAKYDSMPRSAIAAGCVDFVFPPAQIAKELAIIAANANGAAGSLEASADAAKPDDGYHKILVLLKMRTSVDFANYKPQTLRRRIARRMVLNKLANVADYAARLRGDPEELDALFQDLLISVTSFFRNPETFDALKRKVFPKILKDRSADEPVRIWVSGCSTGQEAYSLAMAFLEYTAEAGHQVPLRIFATDLNGSLLDNGRSGLYSKHQVADLSAERLRRFFVKEDGGYRICKPVRELCVFAKHNLAGDPPFSSMDLVSCRNLLIYLEQSLQQRIMPVLHYALKPAGFLLLGNSESVGSATGLFELLDAKHKFYAKRALSPGARALASPVFLPNREPPPKPPALIAGLTVETEAQKQADRALLAQYAPAGVLVNEGMDVLQFRGQTGLYLEPTPGKVSFNLLKMLREGLMRPVRSLVNEAKKTGKAVFLAEVRFRHDHHQRRVNLRVIPLMNLRPPCFLLLFEPVAKRAAGGQSGNGSEPSAHPLPRPLREAVAENAGLRDELAAAKQYLQSVTEQYETANEELQAANEESQSGNEELQSINEELETTKEELESTNEELVTVNEEMGTRNLELQRLNNDLNNVLGGVQMCIVVLDTALSIRRFTPLAEKHLNLMPADLGRPITNIRPNFDLPELENKILATINSLVTTQEEVRDRRGRWFSLRILPYRTADNKIDGAVLVLVDIDALKTAEQQVRVARDYAEGILRTTRDPLLVLREDFRINTANDAFYKTFRLSAPETEGRLVYDIANGLWNLPKLRALLKEVLARKTSFDDFELTHEFEHLGRRTVLLNARPLETPHGSFILLGIDDITEHRLQAAVRESEVRYRRLFEAAKDGIIILELASRKITEVNPCITELLGRGREELLGRELWEIGFFDDQAACKQAFLELEQNGCIRQEDLCLRRRSGAPRMVDFLSNVYDEAGRKIIQCNIRDSTEATQSRAALAESEERFRSLVQTVPQLVWTATSRGEVDYLSPQWAGYTGVSGQERPGESWLNSINPVDRAHTHEAWQDSILTGEEYNVEHRIRGAGGQHRWFQTRAVAVRDHRGFILHWVGTSSDIQAQKESEEQLRQAHDQLGKLTADLELQVAERTAALRETVGELEAFSYSIAHDLRAPLRAMHGFSVILLESCRQKLEPGEYRYLDHIRRAASRLDGLIQDVLNYARLLRSQAPLNRVDLQQLVTDLQQNYPQFQPPTVELTIEGDFPPVWANPALLTQSLSNLLSNAVKFVAPGVQPKIRLWAEERRDPAPSRRTLAPPASAGSPGSDARDAALPSDIWRVRICIQDNGIGIAPENHRRIFRMFERINPAAEFEGTGIGLTIVRKAAERMDGRVGFDSQLGAGSTFWIELKRATE